LKNIATLDIFKYFYWLNNNCEKIIIKKPLKDFLLRKGKEKKNNGRGKKRKRKRRRKEKDRKMKRKG